MLHLVEALLHVCDMTHSYVWHDSITYGTWLIHARDMTHSHCDMTHMTHPYVWHDSFTCVTWRIHILVRPDPFESVPWCSHGLNGACHTYEWVKMHVSHSGAMCVRCLDITGIWMSHMCVVICVSESYVWGVVCLICVSEVICDTLICVSESYVWGVMNESYVWGVMCLVCVSEWYVWGHMWLTHM